MSKSGKTVNLTSACLLKLKAPIEPIPFFVACAPMHVTKKKTAIAEEATWRGQRQHSVRDGARAKTRPATKRLFRGRGCEAAGVKPIKIYHYAKDAIIPLPLRKWQRLTQVFHYPGGAHRLPV